MQGIAEFHKVSYKQFREDSIACKIIDELTPEAFVQTIYDRIKLPKRATGGSAGYDFFAPYPFCLQKGGVATIPTGIRVDMQPGWCLWMMPRSGYGFKYGLRLLNTIGLIDSDYYYAANEGHIIVKLASAANLSIGDDDRFVQGVFLPHGLTRSDCTDGIRTGGFGSTGV